MPHTVARRCLSRRARHEEVRDEDEFRLRLRASPEGWCETSSIHRDPARLQSDRPPAQARHFVAASQPGGRAAWHGLAGKGD